MAVVNFCLFFSGLVLCLYAILVVHEFLLNSFRTRSVRFLQINILKYRTF